MEQATVESSGKGPVTEPLSMKALLEAGVHFGHQTKRWEPRMKQYIFTQRNGIHIIDLQQTLFLIHRACKFVSDLVANGGTILFVGTKKQAQEIVVIEANRCGMFYVNQRWLGGTLTNWQTIKGRIDQLNRLQERQEKGEFARLPKKEGLKLEDELKRLQKYLSGLQHMRTPPTAVFFVDLEKERIAVAETRKMRLPTVALVDTNCNPRLIDHPIPANDDAIRSIKLIVGRIADSVIDGQERRKARLEEDARLLVHELTDPELGSEPAEGIVTELASGDEVIAESAEAVITGVESEVEEDAPSEGSIEREQSEGVEDPVLPQESSNDVSK